MIGNHINIFMVFYVDNTTSRSDPCKFCITNKTTTYIYTVASYIANN